MKLEVYRSRFAETKYQLVPIYNAKNTLEPKSVLDIKLIEVESKEIFTLGEYLEKKDKEIQDLKQEVEKTNKRVKDLLEIVKALKIETREKGII